MTVQAQQFPVAAVGRIVVMVMVLVVDRKLTQLFTAELPSASRTDMRINIQRFGTIGLFLLLAVASRLGDDLVLPAGVC